MELYKKGQTENKEYNLDDQLEEEYIDPNMEDEYEEEDYEEEDPQDEFLEETEVTEADEKSTKVPTAILITIILLLLTAIGVGIYLINRGNTSEAELKDWVATYLYEAVAEDGAGLLTDSEIKKISEDVASQLSYSFEGSTLDLENMEPEQLEQLVLKIRESLLDHGYSLSTQDVTNIAEGVLESYLQKQGVDTTDLAALGSLQDRLDALEATDRQLSSSIANVSATRGQTGATGATGAQGPRGEKGDKGDPGATGATGATGQRGATGATGATGAKGEKGDPGIAGEKGEKGDAGEKGEKGDTGAAGAKGEKGDAGEKGEAGASAFLVFSEYKNGVDGNGKSSFTTTPTDKTKYMGVASGMKAPEDANGYSWSQYKEISMTYDNSTGKPTLYIHN